MECLLAAHRSLDACYRAHMLTNRPCLVAALLLAVAACGGAKGAPGEAPATPAAPAAAAAAPADCRLEGSWTLELTWTDPVAPACGDAKVPWETAMGFVMKPDGSDAEPDSAWGGSDIEVTRVERQGCGVTVSASSEGRESPDATVMAHFVLDGSGAASTPDSGKLTFTRGACQRAGTLQAKRK
jgi:hypothetical protein